ncbi:MAG: VapC toxin family PIN domain ribonuclease [Acidobacteria bacterium]|nr:VapC toxin family PIN domain ribonuclease [Acidobacteriota bacterium]
MTRFLLDINVLIALLDPAHVQHERAHKWFAFTAQKAWATCPLIENAVLRIVGHPRYPNSPGSPAAVADLLIGLRRLPGHAFWPDDVSLLDRTYVNATRLLKSSQVTDTYLLTLARAHNGQLATLDEHLVVDAVADGRQALHLIA